MRWIVSSERVDHLGMRHVYYRQEYDGPQMGRSARVVGTGIALHYAPDGSLRWVRGAQLPDVTQVAPLTLSTAAHAFAAGQLAGASWPGFSPGDPSTWPAGTLADGGANPGCSYFGNCHIEVDGIGLEPAARILFRVLDTQSDPSTTEWRQLPFLALDAAFDLFHDVDPGDPCAFAVQHSVLSAFKAVGYGFPEPPFSEERPTAATTRSE